MDLRQVLSDINNFLKNFHTAQQIVSAEKTPNSLNRDPVIAAACSQASGMGNLSCRRQIVVGGFTIRWNTARNALHLLKHFGAI
jgi:hypothetical protein